MADPTLVQSASHTQASVSSYGLAFASNNTAGNLLVVLVGYEESTAVPDQITCTDSAGNTYVPLSLHVATAGATETTCQAFYVQRCLGGANTVTGATFLTSAPLSGTITIAIHEFSGADLFEQSAYATGTGLAQSSGSLALDSFKRLLFGYEMANTGSGGQASCSTGVGWTVAKSLSQQGVTQYRVASAAASYSSDTTSTAAKGGTVNWIAEIISFWLVEGDAAVTLGAISNALSGQEGQQASGAATLPFLSAAAAAQEGAQGMMAPALKAVSSALRGLYLTQPAGQSGEPELFPGVNAQTGTAYTIQHTDREKLITFLNSAAVAVTIPAAKVAFGSGWRCGAQNKGAGTVTITPAAGTINGAANLALATGRGCVLVSDGTNWQVEGWVG